MKKVRYLVVTKLPPDEHNYYSEFVYVRPGRFHRGRRTYIDRSLPEELWIGLEPPRSKIRKPNGIAQVKAFHLGQIFFVGKGDQEVIHPYTKPWKHGFGYEVYTKLGDALRRSNDLGLGYKKRFPDIKKPVKVVRKEE